MSTQLTLSTVSLAFGHLPLLDRADLRVEAGERLGLIGRNGTGKSTILRLMAGEVEPDTGTIWRSPGIRIARLDQEVPREISRTVFDEVAAGLGDLGDVVAAYHHVAVQLAEGGTGDLLHQLGELQHELEERGGWSVEQRVETVVSRLGLPSERPVSELSGGWRRRVLLAKALVSDPDLLLLDEPTNHLDVEAIRWLEQFLLDYAGALVFVTHDRVLLDRLATRIVELDRGALTSWPGNYGRYLERKADALAVEVEQNAKFDKLLAEEEVWLRQGIKARRTRNEGRVKKLEALRAERAQRRDTQGNVRLEIDGRAASGRLVFELEDVSKSYDGVPVIVRHSQRIMRGDRLGLIGPNGVGKTTFLKLLLGEVAPDSGTVRHGARLDVAYYDQEREQLDPDRSVMDSVSDGSDTIEIAGQRRHVVGYLKDFLFPGERVRSPVASLSGGERNRLLLARLFAKPANVLVLDEPTNDLDIETLELLEELIDEFPGTILLVSHDRAFLNNVVTSCVAFEGDGILREYVGGYDDWLRQRDAMAAQPSAVPVSAPRVQPPPARAAESTPRRKLTFREQREHDALPAAIARLEEEQVNLQRQIAKPDFYKEQADRIKDTLARIDRVAVELDALYERWWQLENL